MWTIAWAAAPHRLVDNVVGFLSGNRLAFRVHLGKILPERPDDLLASLIGYGEWLESLNADSFLLRNGPPEQAFDCHLLIGREVFHVTDHVLPTSTFPSLSIFSLKNEPGEQIYFSYKMSLETGAN